MTFDVILAKLTGGRFCCSSGCCGEGYAKPCAKKELGFDTILLTRLIIASILFAAALVLTKLKAPWPLLLLIVSALAAGYDILAAAVVSLMKRRWFDRTVTMTLACVLAFGLGLWSEGAALVIIFQIGSVFIDYAFARTRLSVMEAFATPDDRPVSVLTEAGEEASVLPDAVPVGARILLRPGDTVPCDCIVLDGAGSLNAAPLGGGTEPLFVTEGDELLSGCVLLTGDLHCEVTVAAPESAAALLLASVEKSAAQGACVPWSLARYIDLFAPVMLIVAILAAGVIPLIYKVDVSESLRRALTFIIAANPCAMFIAAPLIRLATIAGAAKRGILFRSCAAMDETARTAAVAFDRAGTLSDGRPRVTAVKSARLDADTLLKITAHAMAYSSDKLARSVISAYGGTIYIELVSNFVEYPGSGVEVYVENVRICAGSYDLMEAKGVSVPTEDMTDELAIYVSVADDYAGRIVLTDGLRRDAALGVREIEGQGVDSVVMFTDEPSASAAKTAAELGIKEYYSAVAPSQLPATLSGIKQSLPPECALLLVRAADSAVSGDSGADINAVTGGVEALSAPENADVTLLGGVCGVASAIAAAKSSQRYVMLFAGGAAIVKLILMALAFVGIGAAWFAVFIDCAAALGAILASITAINAGVGRI